MKPYQSKIRHAVLDESGNVIEAGLLEWAHWFELNRGHRVIQQDTIEGHLVSTVFGGLDLQYDPNGPPLWFETLVFDPAEYDPSRDRMCREEAGFQERYSTLQEAIKGHALAVEWLKERIYANRSVTPERRTRTL
jgi:hypothetical protein